MVLRRRWWCAAGVVGVAMLCASGLAVAHGNRRLHLHVPISGGSHLEAHAIASGSVLVRLGAGGHGRRAAAVVGRLGALGATPTGVAGWWVVRVSDSQRSLAALRREFGAARVQPNYLVHAFSTPNDPLLGSQEFVASIRLTQAWSHSRGRGQTIAIVDSGVTGVADVKPHLVGQKNFVGGSKPGDVSGHGTEVAGVAAAATNNGVGIAGVAWDARILSVRVLGAAGSGTEAHVAAGIVWAVKHGATVINLSLGGPGNGDVLRSAVRYAVSHNVVVVAAVGNQASDRPMYPAAYKGVVGVSATDSAEGRFAYFSNHGPWVDVAAPGANVLAPTKSGAYAYVSGTSFAAPIVSGVAALVRSQHHKWTAAHVARVIEYRSEDMDFPGTDWFYGHGWVDAGAAVGGPIHQNPSLYANHPPEPNDLPLRATPLAGTFSPGVLAPSGDVDWYRVKVGHRGWLTVSVTPPPFDPQDIQQMAPVLAVYNPTLKRLRAQTATYWGQPVSLQVPARSPGTYYVRLANYGGSSTAGLGYYTITESQSRAPAQRFTTGQPYFVGYRHPAAVAIADVTGDGRNDVLATTDGGAYTKRAANYRLFVFPQLRGGGLGHRKAYPIGTGSYCNAMGIATADLNGDHRTDVVVATDNGLDVFHQHLAALQGPVLLGKGTNYCYPKTVDWNGDGRPDILASTKDGVLDLFINTDTGFHESELATLGHDTYAVGDLNQDGRPDVVSACCGTTAVPWKVVTLLHQSDGSLASHTYQTATTWPLGGIAIGDVTGDGRPDVVTGADANPPNSHIEVFPQTSAGSLANPIVSPSTDLAEQILTADVNRDGRTDVIVGHDGGPIGVYLQQPSGQLAPEVLSTLTNIDNQYLQWQAFAVGDINGDGAPDAVTTEQDDYIVVARQYTLAWPRPGKKPWILNSTPAPFIIHVPPTTPLRIHTIRALKPSSVNPRTVRLTDRTTATPVRIHVTYNPLTHIILIHPLTPLATKHAYAITVSGIRDLNHHALGRTQVTQFKTSSTR